jgi:hypothetical protein
MGDPPTPPTLPQQSVSDQGMRANPNYVSYIPEDKWSYRDTVCPSTM